MPYQVSMMGWVGSGGDFCGLGWVQKFWVGLGWVLKSDPQPTLTPPSWIFRLYEEKNVVCTAVKAVLTV